MPLLDREIEAKTAALLDNEEGKRVLAHYLASLFSENQELAQRFLADPPSISDEDKRFAERIGVKSYSPAESKALELVSLLQYFEARRKLLANAIPATVVAEMLGVSRPTPHDRARRNELLGIIDKNVMKFPEWQFDPSGPDGVVAGLREVLDALKCSTLAKIGWLSQPNRVFEGQRPIDVLKRGGQDQVLREAASVGVAQ